MRRAEKIMKGKVAFKREMDLVLPRATSDALWQEATRRLDGFLTRYGSLPKGVHMHTDKRILPAAAVYLTIRDAVGHKEAYRIIEDASIRNCKPIAAKLMRLMRLPGMRSLFVQAWDPLTRKLFGPKNGFENVFYPRKKGEFRMDVRLVPVLPLPYGAWLSRAHKDLLRKRREDLWQSAAPDVHTDVDPRQGGETV